MHIHVGYNMPGYLPGSDPVCTDDVDTAIEYLKSELTSIQGDYYERCAVQSPSLRDWGSECCDWCSVASDVEAALSRIADGDTAYHLRNARGTVHRFSPPEGSDMVYWVDLSYTPWNCCDLNQD